MSRLAQPAGHDASFFGYTTITDSETVVAVKALRPIRRDQRDMPSLHGGQECEGIVGDIRPEDEETALVAQLFVTPDGNARFTARQSASDLRNDLNRTIKKPFVESVFAGQYDGIQT